MKDLNWNQTCNKDFHAAPKDRKHIILMDGTWNDETGVCLDGLVTNIVNLSRVFPSNEKDQIVRYHRGVGNDNDNNKFYNIFRGVTGKGVRKIVDDAYARFVQDWQVGDTIYIFGFSRGAAGARMLASKIAAEGIPSSITVSIRPRANKETNVIEQIITDVVTTGSPATNHKVDVEFLGVWDTVSSLGFPNVLLRFFGRGLNDLFTNNHIAPNILRAVHLVAIDETRNPFVPSLMNQKEGVVHEVWFPGVHSDIGGSYPEDSVAKVSLHYMFKKLFEWNAQRGLPGFVIDEEQYARHTAEKIDKTYFHFHGDSHGEDLRSIGVQVNGVIDRTLVPKIHDLYNEACKSKEVYSVVCQEKDDVVETRYIQFQYMPFNVKVLNGKFEVVK